MKAAEFNANLLRVRQARLRQTAIRQKVASINGPPTYVRQMVGESVRKARFNAMGAITFNSNADRVEYETAYRHADGLYENQTDQETPGIIDDAPYGREAAGLNDRWSFRAGGDEAPTDNELFLESTATITKAVADGRQYTDVDEAIRANYKMKFVAKHGPMKPPFKGSTMMVSHLSENRDDMKRISLMSQVGEIQGAIEKLQRAQVSINASIQDNESAYYAAQNKYNAARQNYNSARTLSRLSESEFRTEAPISQQELDSFSREMEVAKADMDALSLLLNGGPGSVGLRTQAIEIRKGIAALMRQRSTVSAELGIDPEAQSAAESSARTGGVVGGALGGSAVGAIAALGLVYLFRSRAKGTGRGRGRNPIDIFS